MKRKLTLLAAGLMFLCGQMRSEGTATINLIMPGSPCSLPPSIDAYCEFIFPDDRETTFILGPMTNKDYTSVTVSAGPIRINYLLFTRRWMTGNSYEYIKSLEGTDIRRFTMEELAGGPEYRRGYANVLNDGDVIYLSPYLVRMSLGGSMKADTIQYNGAFYEEVNKDQYEAWMKRITSKKRGAAAGELADSNSSRNIPIVRPTNPVTPNYAKAKTQSSQQSTQQNDSQKDKDMIFTITAETIDAFVLEENEDVVKYIKANSADRTILSMPTDSISTIFYANGQLKEFGHSVISYPVASASKSTEIDTYEEPKAEYIPQQEKRPLYFSMFISAYGYVGKGEGAEKPFGGIGADVTAGVRAFNKHWYFGPAIGFSRYFYNEETTYGKTEVRAYYLPIYANTKIFFLGEKSEKADVFLDLGLGGYLAIKPTTEYTPKSGSRQTYESETNGSLYFHAGAGFTVGVFFMAAGYELKKIKGMDDVTSAAYFKFGVGF